MIRELTKTTWMNPENRCSMSNPEAWQEKNIISAARLVCFTQPQCHQHLQQWERENGHAFGLMLGAGIYASHKLFPGRFTISRNKEALFYECYQSIDGRITWEVDLSRQASN
ncbi:hypothetical protein EUGRSUZ_L01954 [Eucalyptus grandis]|uniref:Uncharacterized protein n=1 Tax=Eucalyptus grandis TaxID=71139 RepID=A0A058ZSY1_EUCGR|nr:hypothetical protein EUGRSUZ_L01954 [Eucalyptus grandis]